MVTRGSSNGVKVVQSGLGRIPDHIKGQARSFQEAKGEVEQCIGLVGTTCDGQLGLAQGTVYLMTSP